jgi:hypothetical protein
MGKEETWNGRTANSTTELGKVAIIVRDVPFGEPSNVFAFLICDQREFTSAVAVRYAGFFKNGQMHGLGRYVWRDAETGRDGDEWYDFAEALPLTLPLPPSFFSLCLMHSCNFLGMANSNTASALIVASLLV